MSRRDADLVYSTDGGRTCPRCERSLDDCACDERDERPEGGPVRVRRESKGRKGKVVTVVTGLPLSDAELSAVAKRWKQRCGSGGTAKDGRVEVQGDHVATLIAELQKMGYEAKRSGG